MYERKANNKNIFKLLVKKKRTTGIVKSIDLIVRANKIATVGIAANISVATMSLSIAALRILSV